ncbi:hypothetical protein B0T11DRAFT_288713 [Plectosphaerella cucumerina]|uniref:Uncharacterized protein n=1 Tax=Plectosphaerella cucumerina TaxID=40658 RepID=A0A8K0TAV2_9PEZI|nr:hypothetical protein B0T11DRAFT_288713 [Plectosphaerella cucumerina]
MPTLSQPRETWSIPPTAPVKQSPARLTEEQKEHFLSNGWIRLTECFTREQAEWVQKDLWARLGMDPDDKSTWEERRNMPFQRSFDAALLAPKAWSAITELCGGEDRITKNSREWRDALIVNLGKPEYEGVELTHPRELDNWHVDGDFFVHYLDSPEQALLVIPLYTDIASGGGGTMICPEAIPKVARHLYDHPEGVSPYMVARGEPQFSEEAGLGFFLDTARSCNEFVEVTGSVGDVFLMHPLMLHSFSRNRLRHLRVITNPPVHFREPMIFDRPDGEYSLVEKMTLRALGKEALPGWRISAPREQRIPARLKIQAKMKEEELKRLGRST